MLAKLETYFSDLGRGKSLGLGVLIGAGITVLALLIGQGVFVFGFFVYFPFHAWLVISLFLVVFSRLERARLVGENRSFIGAFFGRVFSPYGVFCMGWFYVLTVAIGTLVDGTWMKSSLN